MENGLFSEFGEMLRSMSEAELALEIDEPKKLVIEASRESGRQIEIVYAPFDQLNSDADLVIVGLTPGRQQMRNALVEAHRRLKAGHSAEEILSAVKTFASFSGPMRPNLIAMLDSIGVHGLLGINSSASLWSDCCHRIHFTSALRYPVFVDGQNFSGAPSILGSPLLRTALTKWFAAEMVALPNAIFVPLGSDAAAAVHAAAQTVGVKTTRILSGLPHPSGANSERIAFFLGRKRREQLSNKVNPARLVAARVELESKISALGG